MKRAKKEQSDKEKIAIVDDILQNGKYLKETLYDCKFIKNSKSTFGYKTITCENKLDGYDKAFFEILKNDRAKSFFANYYRFLEIGEFKDDKLDGVGGIYLYDFISKDQIEVVFLFGRFNKGFPENELYRFSSHENELENHINMDWDNGEFIAYYQDSKNAHASFMKSNIFYYSYKKISQRKYTYKEKKWWEEYKKLYLTNNRPKTDDLKDVKILKVNKFIKEGKYLKEKFIPAPIKINPTSIFGYKEFEVNKIFGKFIGYDRGFYKTLKNDKAKEHFANYYRKLEIGEFKKGNLHGEGGRYLYDYRESPSLIILWGKFVNGYLNGRVQYITENDKEGILAYLSFWSKGELIRLEKRDKEYALEISNNYFADPWECLNVHVNQDIIEKNELDELRDKMKNDEEGIYDSVQGLLDAVDWWDKYKKDYQRW